MKNLKKFVRVISFVLVFSMGYSQTPPPPNGGNNGQGGTPVGGGAPIGGGIFILSVMAMAYGFRKRKVAYRIINE